MSQENVETVRAFFDPLARGDLSRWFAEVTDDFVFVASPEVPDAGTYRGEDARRWITTWAESFEGYTIEATEFTDAGDRVFLEHPPAEADRAEAKLRLRGVGGSW